MANESEWYWPTDYNYLSGYDWADNNGSHHGIDIKAPMGADIYASTGGTVEYAGLGTDANGQNDGYGNLVIIRSPAGFLIYLAHLSKILVSAGQKVKGNTVIGLAGSTGNSTGAHLHYEIRKVTGGWVNPWYIFPESPEVGAWYDYSGGTSNPKGPSPGLPGNPSTSPGAPGYEPSQPGAATGENGPGGITAELTGFLEYQYHVTIGTPIGQIDWTFTVNYGNLMAVLVGLMMVIIGLYGLVQIVGKQAVKDIPGGAAVAAAALPVIPP